MSGADFIESEVEREPKVKYIEFVVPPQFDVKSTLVGIVSSSGKDIYFTNPVTLKQKPEGPVDSQKEQASINIRIRERKPILLSVQDQRVGDSLTINYNGVTTTGDSSLEHQSVTSLWKFESDGWVRAQKVSSFRASDGPFKKS